MQDYSKTLMHIDGQLHTDSNLLCDPFTNIKECVEKTLQKTLILCLEVPHKIKKEVSVSKQIMNNNYYFKLKHLHTY